MALQIFSINDKIKKLSTKMKKMKKILTLINCEHVDPKDKFQTTDNILNQI